LLGRLQTCVRSLKSKNLPFTRWRIFVGFRNNVGIIAHYDNRPFWIPAGTNKDDLECPIQLKVRMSHGLSADSIDTSLASQLYSCKTDALLSEVHDQ